MSGAFVVSQLGARMHYAVPRIFAERGMLSHFYTDICATKGWPRLLNAVPRTVLPQAFRRLAGRQPKGVPPDLTSVFSMFGTQNVLKRMLCRGDVIEETDHAIWAGSQFSQRVVRCGFHEAQALYAFSGDALEQMRAARKQGLRTVVEQMIAPRDVVEALVDNEIRRYPAWTLEGPRQNPYASTFARREKAEWALADLIICPSEFVRMHVARCGGPAERCVVVPYGVDAPPADKRTFSPAGPLHILTVGEVGLRKGSPYVVEAARLTGGKAHFRMAGRPNVPKAIQSEISQWVELRGIVPRAQIADEFAWADVFLLPSICEGSATAVYEALAAGLPVITTENTGSVVRDGIEGFIVPTGNAEAIAAAVERLSANRDLLIQMSDRARLRAAEFTVAAYGKRLIGALSTLELNDTKRSDDGDGTQLKRRHEP